MAIQLFNGFQSVCQSLMQESDEKVCETFSKVATVVAAIATVAFLGAGAVRCCTSLKNRMFQREQITTAIDIPDRTPPSSASSSVCYITRLPDEVLLEILKLLDPHELLALRLMNRQLYALSKDNMPWREILVTHFGKSIATSVKDNTYERAFYISFKDLMGQQANKDLLFKDRTTGMFKGKHEVFSPQNFEEYIKTLSPDDLASILNKSSSDGFFPMVKVIIDHLKLNKNIGTDSTRDVHKTGPTIETAFHQACWHGQKRIVEMFLTNDHIMKMMSPKEIIKSVELIFTNKNPSLDYNSYYLILSTLIENDHIMKIIFDDQNLNALFSFFIMNFENLPMAVSAFFSNENATKRLSDSVLFESYRKAEKLESNDEKQTFKGDSVLSIFLKNPSVMKRINDFSILHPDSTR